MLKLKRVWFKFNYQALLLPLFLLTGILLLTTTGIFASSSSYYLDQSRLMLKTQPDSNTASGVIKVTSNSSERIKLKIIPKLWNLSADGILLYHAPPPQDYNLLEHLSINPEEFEVAPNKSRLVRFAVKLPAQPRSQEQHFQLLFEPVEVKHFDTQRDKSEANNSVNHIINIIPVFTTTVYVTQGEAKPNVAIDQFTCETQASHKQDNLLINLSLNNSGEQHARLFGHVLITKQTDEAQPFQPLQTLELNKGSLMLVLPGGLRKTENAFPVSPTGLALTSGQYRLELRLVDERNLQPAIQGTCDLSIQ